MKAFTVLICAYGDHPNYSERCLNSVVTADGVRELCDVHVGLSECCPYTVDAARKLYDQGKLDVLVEAKRNVNKDPLMRVLLDLAQTPYILWLDDDSWFTVPDWPRHVDRFCRRGGFDVAGHVYFMQMDYSPGSEYLRFLSKRPWWRGRLPADGKTFFATGGGWAADAAFLRRHLYPDKAMVKRSDDVLLGELLRQVDGRLVGFDDEIMRRIKINDGERRGSGEDPAAFRFVDPITGTSST